MEPELTDREVIILDQIRDSVRAQARNGWPGLPLAQLVMSDRDALQSLQDRGLVEIVEHPSASRPGTVRRYVRVCASGD